MTSFTKSLVLFSLPLGEPKIFCCWQDEGGVIYSVCEFSSVMCRGVKLHCWMLLPEPPYRCVWYGGEGKVPLELCQEPLEQEVALP